MLGHQNRRGLTLIELVVAVGLLTIIMLPVVGLPSTAARVYETNSELRQVEGQRLTAIDGAIRILRSAQQVTRVRARRLDLILQDGRPGQLRFTRGSLLWTLGQNQQTLGTNLQSVRFGVQQSGQTVSDGTLVSISVSARAAPTEDSTTFIWVRPTI